MNSSGILYICPTPIGNLEDITKRVLRVLSEVDAILCEDTRVSSKLLNHYGINTRLISCHKYSEKEKSARILEMLKAGTNLALISDAGTPLINDPGVYLLEELLKENIKVVPLPGASALTTFLSGVFNPSGTFFFAGFLPRTDREREELFDRYKNTSVVFFESPNRLIDTLSFLDSYSPDRTVVIGRELTKINEEILHLKPREAIEYYKKHVLKGELVVALISENIEVQNIEDDKILAYAKKLDKLGYSAKDSSKIISVLFDVPKNYVYALIIK